MTELALQAIRTATFVDADCFANFPVLARLLRIDVQIGLPSEVEPIMRIHAVLLLVVALWIGTPNGLIMEVVEVNVSFVFTNQINGNFTFGVSERAILAIVTLAAETHSAKLRPVFVWVVELFHSCVAVNAGVTLRTLFFLGNIAAKF